MFAVLQSKTSRCSRALNNAHKLFYTCKCNDCVMKLNLRPLYTSLKKVWFGSARIQWISPAHKRRKDKSGKMICARVARIPGPS